MKLLRTVVLLALAVVALTAAPHSASAQNIQVIQRGCDTLSFNPPLVRVTFAVLNLGQIPICSIHLNPVAAGPPSPDSCAIIECSVPTPGWVCNLNPGGGADWNVVPGYPCIFQFQKHEPFDIVLDPFYCCYRADFDDPSGQIFASQLVCFECDKPVANSKSTWGGLRVRYR